MKVTFVLLAISFFGGCATTDGATELLFAARAANGQKVCFTAKHTTRPELSGSYCIYHVSEK